MYSHSTAAGRGPAIWAGRQEGWSKEENKDKWEKRKEVLETKSSLNPEITCSSAIYTALCPIFIWCHLNVELVILDTKGTLQSRRAVQRGALRWQDWDSDKFIDPEKGKASIHIPGKQLHA